MAMGRREYQELKRDAATIVLERMPETAGKVEDYAMEAIDVRNTIVSKMKLMTSDEYEDLLRPAFKQDEWKIVAIGAVLGFLVGEVQVRLLTPGLPSVVRDAANRTTTDPGKPAACAFPARTLGPQASPQRGQYRRHFAV